MQLNTRMKLEEFSSEAYLYNDDSLYICAKSTPRYVSMDRDVTSNIHVDGL